MRHHIFGGLSSRLFKDMLGCEKKMRCEPCDPVGKRDDEMILFFFIHGGEYLREFLVNKWVVVKTPLEQGISPVVLATK
jgi:hypothetical protein